MQVNMNSKEIVVPIMYSLQQYYKQVLFTITYFILFTDSSFTQPNTSNDLVAFNYKAYLTQIQTDSNMQLVSIKKIIPTIQIDLRYATANNFTKHILYPTQADAYICLPVAKALLAIQNQLKLYGLGLKIYDAYRPYTISKKMWTLIHDTRYVASPGKGSNHNRGLAVDVTLIYLKTGREILMPTAFDNFSNTANHTFTHLPNAIVENRKLLKTVMEQNGFKSLNTEWWHYAFITSKDFPVLDVLFKDLMDNIKKK